MVFSNVEGHGYGFKFGQQFLLLELAEGKKDKIHKLLDVNHKAV